MIVAIPVIWKIIWLTLSSWWIFQQILGYNQLFKHLFNSKTYRGVIHSLSVKSWQVLWTCFISTPDSLEKFIGKANQTIVTLAVRFDRYSLADFTCADRSFEIATLFATIEKSMLRSGTRPWYLERVSCTRDLGLIPSSGSCKICSIHHKTFNLVLKFSVLRSRGDKVIHSSMIQIQYLNGDLGHLIPGKYTGSKQDDWFW